MDGPLPNLRIIYDLLTHFLKIIDVPLHDYCALANFWSWRPWNGILNLLLTRFKLNKSKVSVDCDFHKLATKKMLKLLGMLVHWSTKSNTEKFFSSIGCAMNDKSYRFVKIWWSAFILPDDSLMTGFWRLADNCKLPIIIVNQKQRRHQESPKS